MTLDVCFGADSMAGPVAELGRKLLNHPEDAESAFPSRPLQTRPSAPAPAPRPRAPRAFAPLPEADPSPPNIDTIRPAP